MQIKDFLGAKTRSFRICGVCTQNPGLEGRGIASLVRISAPSPWQAEGYRVRVEQLVQS
jgi:hypothetical protein